MHRVENHEQARTVADRLLQELGPAPDLRSVLGTAVGAPSASEADREPVEDGLEDDPAPMDVAPSTTEQSEVAGEDNSAPVGVA